jgi:hypothetical protein
LGRNISSCDPTSTSVFLFQVNKAGPSRSLLSLFFAFSRLFASFFFSWTGSLLWSTVLCSTGFTSLNGITPNPISSSPGNYSLYFHGDFVNTLNIGGKQIVIHPSFPRDPQRDFADAFIAKARALRTLPLLILFLSCHLFFPVLANNALFGEWAFVIGGNGLEQTESVVNPDTEDLFLFGTSTSTNISFA